MGTRINLRYGGFRIIRKSATKVILEEKSEADVGDSGVGIFGTIFKEVVKGM